MKYCVKKYAKMGFERGGEKDFGCKQNQDIV